MNLYILNTDSDSRICLASALKTCTIIRITLKIEKFSIVHSNYHSILRSILRHVLPQKPLINNIDSLLNEIKYSFKLHVLQFKEKCHFHDPVLDFNCDLLSSHSKKSSH